MNTNRSRAGVGVSLADSGVRGVVLHNSKDKRIVVDDAYEVSLSFRPGYHQAINSSRHVVDGIKKIQNNLKVTRAHCGIPSRHYFYRCLTIPKKDVFDQDSLQQFMHTWITNHVHLPVAELTCEYEILEEGLSEWQVAIAVVPQTVLARYRSIFVAGGIRPISLGTHIDSLHQTCSIEADDATNLILELEPQSAHFVVTKNKRPLWNHVVYGPTVEDKNVLSDHAKSIYDMWHDVDGLDWNVYRPGVIRRIVVVGGQAQTEEIARHINQQLAPRTNFVTDMVQQASLEKDVAHRIHRDDLHRFSAAISLAQEGLH